MNQELESFFLLAKSNTDKHQFIIRDLGHFLKSLGISDTIIALEDNLRLSEEQILKIEMFFLSYLDGLPLDYILNESVFYGNKFYVDSRVLIPRPETELIIDWVFQSQLSNHSLIAELGTGSGCISISLAIKNPDFKIIASDISSIALEVANFNVRSHNVKNILLAQSNWMSCIKSQSLDLIISNPPYLKPNDPHLKDLKHEPSIALIAKNGSQSFHEIAAQAILSLKVGGKIIFEHGYSQGSEVSNILKDFGFKNIVTCKDFQGLDRYTYANK